MTRVTSTPLGQGRTHIVHEPTGSELIVDVSPEFGGTGSAFSSVDLVAAALGSCISSTIEPLATRHGIDLADLVIDVDKEVATDPKRITRLAVTIRVKGTPADERLVASLERAAKTCAVHRSLHPDIDSPFTVVFEEAGSQDADTH